MRVYLIRHAVAHARDAERWPDDSGRPLTLEGEERFRAAVPGLRRAVPEVDLLLSSPFTRAWQTAAILSAEAGWPEPVSLPEMEPHLPPHKAVQAFERFTGAGKLAIALVGHRPQLHGLAAYLLTGTPDGFEVSIKKGGALCVRFKGAPAPGSGSLRWSLPPAFLADLGG